jgi:hypothetical protein
MAEQNQWQAEFERLGELLVYDNVKQGADLSGYAVRSAMQQATAHASGKFRPSNGAELRFDGVLAGTYL